MTDPNDTQVGGKHYRSQYQHWDFVHDTGMGYLQGQITKYISRYRHKNGVEDLKKAMHFAEKWQAERAKARRTTSEYAHANGMRSLERNALEHIALGRAGLTVETLKELIQDYEASEPQGRGYVDQD